MATFDSNAILRHMDVITADAEKIGKVDHLQGSRIKLAKTSSPDGQHHFVPLDWIDHVNKHVQLNKTLGEIRAIAQLSTTEANAVPDPTETL